MLIDPLGFEVEKSYLQKLGIQKAKEVFLRICRREDVERFIRMVYGKPPCVPEIVLDYMAHTKCHYSRLDTYKSRSLYRRDGRWVFADRLPAMARRIHVPTLILWGKADKILSYKNAAGFRRHIPHADWVLMEGIGHAPMMEAPNKTANIVQRFLEKRIEKKKH